MIFSIHRRTKFYLLIRWCSAVVLCNPVQAANQIAVIDYAGNKVTLEKPAQRIIALSPHAVENSYSAGAGDHLVGTVAYSDYPDAAKNIQQIGSNNLLNLEAIIALQPDLIIAWQSGNTDHSLQQLKNLGFNLYIDEPRNLADIAKSIRDIGILAGTQASATAAADDYLRQLKTLADKYHSSLAVTVFYEVWNQPLQTLNGDHIVSAAIELCGGRNIYADQAIVAPVINIESIIQRDPQVIIASGVEDRRPSWLDDWQQWPTLTAVKNRHLFYVPADHLQRHTVRLLLGINAICDQLTQARTNLQLDN